MKKTILLLVTLILWTCTGFAGTYLINDSGQAATALRVSFADPVTIISFGDSLSVVEPQTEATEFLFSAGEVQASVDGLWLNWTPDTVEMTGYEWIEGSDGADEAFEATPGMNIFAVPVEWGGDVDPPLEFSFLDPRGDSTTPGLSYTDIVSVRIVLPSERRVSLEMDLAGSVPRSPGTNRYVSYTWRIDKLAAGSSASQAEEGDEDPVQDTAAWERIATVAIHHGNPGSWTASGWWGWLYRAGRATRLEFSSTLAYGTTVRVKVNLDGIRAGDTVRLVGITEYQWQGTEDITDQAPDIE